MLKFVNLITHLGLVLFLIYVNYSVSGGYFDWRNGHTVKGLLDLAKWSVKKDYSI